MERTCRLFWSLCYGLLSSFWNLFRCGQGLSFFTQILLLICVICRRLGSSGWQKAATKGGGKQNCGKISFTSSSISMALRRSVKHTALCNFCVDEVKFSGSFAKYSQVEIKISEGFL